MKQDVKYHVLSYTKTGTADEVISNSIFITRSKIVYNLYLLSHIFDTKESYYYKVFFCSGCGHCHFFDIRF